MGKTQVSPGSELQLSRAENDLLKELTTPGSKVTSVIPDNADPDTLWRDLETCVKAARIVSRTHGKLLPLIGRALLVYKQNPEYYQAKGFSTWDEFVKKGVQESMGLSRSDSYEALQLLRSFPSLTIEEYCSVPRRSWQKLLKAGVDQTKTDHGQLIDIAATTTTEQLVEQLEDRGLLNPGEGTHVLFSFPTTLDVMREINRVLSDPRVQAINGTSDKSVIIMNALREASTEWMQAEEMPVGDMPAGEMP